VTHQLLRYGSGHVGPLEIAEWHAATCYPTRQPQITNRRPYSPINSQGVVR
jgi:hypothetical protein